MQGKHRASPPTDSFFLALVGYLRWQQYILLLTKQWVLSGWWSCSKEVLKLERVHRIRNGLSSAAGRIGKLPCNCWSRSSVCKISILNRCNFCAEVKNKLGGMGGKKPKLGNKCRYLFVAALSFWVYWRWSSEILQQEMSMCHKSFVLSPFKILTFPTPASGLFSILKWLRFVCFLQCSGRKMIVCYLQGFEGTQI